MPQLAVYYEHPDWFRPLFGTLERRGVPYVKLDAGAHIFDLAERKPDYDLVFNRASPSGYLRGHLGTIFSTWSWLSHLERIGVPVVNGIRPRDLQGPPTHGTPGTGNRLSTGAGNQQPQRCRRGIGGVAVSNCR
jgi:hypothetical protein